MNNCFIIFKNHSTAVLLNNNLNNKLYYYSKMLIFCKENSLLFRCYLSSIANIRTNCDKNNNNNKNKIINNNCIKINNKKNINILNFYNIPCARRLPLIGTKLDFIVAGGAPKLHKYIDKRHHELGPIFREKLGSTEIVFLSSANLMRSVFLYEGQYPEHPLPDAWVVYNKKHNCKRGLFFMNGQEWLSNRRIMNKLMLNNGSTNWMKFHIDNVTDNLIDNWKIELKNLNNNNKMEIFNLEGQLYRWSINVIISLMFGNHHNYHRTKKLLLTKQLQDTIEEFAQNVHKIFLDSSKLMNFSSKLAELLKLKIWTEFENDVHKVLKLGYSIIDLGIKEFGYNNGLLAMMLENKMPLDDLKRIFVDLIIAAGDTTAFSSQWILYALSTNENIQTKTRNNILENSNNYEIDIETPYIRGLIREVLRLYPVAPFIGRILATDAIFDKYKVNKGTLVILSLYTSGRDEKNFPNPFQVNPERWIRRDHTNNNESPELISSSKGTLPFAIGIRSCIGRKIALLQMQSLITKVISNFELKCLNENSVDIILRLVAVPDNQIRLQIKNLF